MPRSNSLNHEGNIPALSTSVLNSQPAKVFSMKNNQFPQFNSQTAQRRELENIFNTNALANFDVDMSYHAPKPYVQVYYLLLILLTSVVRILLSSKKKRLARTYSTRSGPLITRKAGSTQSQRSQKRSSATPSTRLTASSHRLTHPA